MATDNKKNKQKIDLNKQPTSAPFPSTGSEYVTTKIMAEENGLREIFKNILGVDIRVEKQRIHQPKATSNQAGKTTNMMFVLSGNTLDQRKRARIVLNKVVDDIQSQETQALKSVLNAPKKFAKKHDLTLTEDEIFLLKENLMEFVDSTKPSKQNHKNKNAKGDEALSIVRTALNRVKNTLPNSQSAAVIRELLDSATKDFPSTTDLSEYYVDKIQKIGVELDRQIISLDERIIQNNKIQANSHIEAKHRFSPEQRSQVENSIEQTLVTKSITMDEMEKNILLSSALFEMDSIVVNKFYLENIVQNAINPNVPKAAKPKAEVKFVAPIKSVNPYMEYALLDGKYVPNTDSQADQVAKMRTNGLTIVIGDAGTGKSLAMAAYALHLLKTEKKKIIIVRPMVELGNKETMGFLPGGELEKIGPGFRPILKNFLKLTPKSELKKMLGLDEKKSPAKTTSILDTLLPDQDIQLTPLAYIRGDNFPKCTILVEEAQNLTVADAEALCTRAAEGCTVILGGDKIQTDLPTKDRQGRWLDEKQMPALPVMLVQAKNEPWVGVVIHPAENIVRSELAKNAVGMFAKIRNNKEAIYQEAFKDYGKETVYINTANNGSKVAANNNVSPS